MVNPSGALMEYEVTAPDGRKFIVTAPEGASQDDVLRYAQSQFAQMAPPAPSTMDTARDVGANLAGAAGRGVSNLLGLPGDIQGAIDRGSRWAYERVTGSPAAPPISTVQTPTSESVRAGMRNIGVPVDRRAETPVGRVAQDAVEAATSLPLNAPMMAYSALSGAAGGAAAEGLRAGGFGQTAQDVGRVAASVVAPLAASSTINRAQYAREASRVPTTDQLREQARNLYQRAEAAGLRVTPQGFGQAVDDFERTLRAEGFNARLHPRAAAALDEMRAATQAGQPLSLEQIDQLRRITAAAGRSIEPDERRVGSLLIDKLDDWLSNIKPGDVAAGNAREAVGLIREARATWSRMRRGEIIEGIFDRLNPGEGSAALRASQFSQSGIENALRTEFRQLARNDKRMRAFSEDERKLIRQVAMGGPLENGLRWLGKFAPRGVVSFGMGAGVGSTVGAAVGGPVGAAVGGIGVPAVGMLGNAAAARMTMNNANRAALAARAGAPLPVPGASGSSALSALLGGERAALEAYLTANPVPATTR